MHFKFVELGDEVVTIFNRLLVIINTRAYANVWPAHSDEMDCDSRVIVSLEVLGECPS